MARLIMFLFGLVSIANALEETVNAMQRENVENSQSHTMHVSSLTRMVKDVVESKSLKTFAHSALAKALMSAPATTLAEVISELTDVVMPGLNSAHASDQQLLQNSEDSVCQCTTTRTDLDDAIALEDQAFQTAKGEHAQCHVELDQKIQTETSNCNLAEQTYNSAVVPNCAKPEQSGFQAFLKTAKEWYEAMFAKYKKEAEDCAAATQAREEKAQECIEKQAQTESSYCTWYASQWAQWTGYYSCIQSANNTDTGYPAVKTAVQTREAARKEQVTHFQRVVCILRDVLSMNTSHVTASAISAAANTCADEVPDLTGFNIDYAFSDSCNYVAHNYNVSAPGDGVWGPQHYGNLNVGEIVKCYKGKHATPAPTASPTAPPTASPTASPTAPPTAATIHIDKFNDISNCVANKIAWTEALDALDNTKIILDDNVSPLRPTAMKITLGGYTDYFKPTGSHTFKDMIFSHDKHTWSADGTNWVLPEYYSAHYGGSGDFWPKNNVAGETRDMLPFWGDAGSTSVCGYDGKEHTWQTPFEVEFVMA